MSATITQQREIHLKSRPQGLPTPDNFELVETAAPQPQEGEILVENEWFSVDPYMRGRMNDGPSYVPPFQIGQPLEGGCVGKVIASSHRKYAAGDYVLGNLGWRKYWTSDGKGIQKIDASQAPPQTFLGVLGMTGMTAYVGLMKIGQLTEGDAVFVSAASGAVGSIVCQIARQKKCRVVGSAGSAKKIDWLKTKAGVDEAFNYHEVDDVSARLRELFPEGIDLYFDNVGGDHLAGAIDNMKDFGRIVCCGMISSYNDAQPEPGPANLFKIIVKRLRVQGFIVRDHLDMYREFQQQMGEWIAADKIVWKETVTQGLENAPQAFINLFHGDKMGKALVQV
ncbi:NADP-dependent oxidoreductase [Lignipirellula cremea]|uniref:NADP-dependent oxidoreductase YfmJ n=1 Tax=Lignipirellula cremea TaxID=2528010 RepID=A0A518DL80_9BACT|nr:NADP-dependent oxidoreductase [Lignipirellula cremea]QDU92593.1 Putative NADP-dependent oxidoreductase YfmJ [Lignipirellula cremea]